jgi:hypothetical protein
VVAAASSAIDPLTVDVGVGKARDTKTSVIGYIGKNRVRMSCLRADNPRDLSPFHHFRSHTPAEETPTVPKGSSSEKSTSPRCLNLLSELPRKSRKETASAMENRCSPTIIAPGKGAPECASVQDCSFI